ncbi:MAG: hypothetical protein KC492_16500, partial [Myxococcales bacterium]|nr:hypothetical protein [Myxococcales bacterium]
VGHGGVDAGIQKLANALRLEMRTAAFSDPLRGLLEYLRSPTKWEMLSGVFAAASLHTLGKQLPGSRVAEALRALRTREEPKLPSLEAQSGSDSLLCVQGFGGQDEVVLMIAASKADAGRLHTDSSLVQGVLRLDDRAEKRQHPAFIPAWRQFLRAYNVLQSLPNIAVVTREQLDDTQAVVAVLGETAAAPKYSSPPTQTLLAADVGGHRLEELPEAVTEQLEELAGDDVRALVTEAAHLGFVEFAVPFELVSESLSAETASIEVGWEAQKVGLYFERERSSAKRLEEAGWRLFLIESDPKLGELIAALRGASRGDG